PGATGNTSSEDLVYLLMKCGYDTGINFDKLLAAAKYTKRMIDGNYSGHHINIPEHPCVITQK
ncbi:MAG: hydroxymethylglutaryl-CoA lyase, partial [Clostridium sp.]